VSLETFLPREVFAFLLVFARIGTFFLFIPGIGEAYVPQRSRLALALLVSALALSLVRGDLPPEPTTPANLLIVLGKEMLVALMMGLAVRMMLSALNVAGTIIAFQTGLAFITSVDPTQGTQGALIATLMTLIGIACIFAFDLHHLMLAGIIQSYVKFPAGVLPPVADFMQLTVKAVGDSFALGLQLAGPFIAFGLVYNVGLGLLARLMPQMQVTMIGMPLQIMLGFALLSVTMSAIMMTFLDQFARRIGFFLG